LLKNPPGFHSFMLGDRCPEMSATYNWVDTEAQLEHLARLLGEERAFAVDTEQHSIRSFLGYTALMQVITGRGACTLNIQFFISLLYFNIGLFCFRSLPRMKTI